MVALFHAPFLLMHCGNYATAEAIVNELVSLARNSCMAIKGINSISAVVPVTFGECKCGTRSAL
jgi:hypothetical protein